MPRLDLLALTADDLAAITNRGVVKRAEKELEAGAPTYEMTESPDGELVVAWSDGVTCRFPPGETVHNAVCSSGVVGVSRHVIRSVLAYCRRYAAARATSPAEANAAEASFGDSPTTATAATEATGAWDPGGFTDEALIARFRQAAVTKARQRFEQGVLVELTRGAKPMARFLDEPCTLRFLVPGDLRYVTADCAEPLLATYVPLAVWAFRALPAEKTAGLVSLQPAELPTPTSLLDTLEALLAELACDGLAGIAASWPQRLARLEAALRDEGLVWPAELLADLHHQVEMYQGHDARFDPLEVVDLAGELAARNRAIRGGSRAAPQLLIRGSRSDRPTDIAGGRLIGLGVGVRLGRRVTTLSAYLQDADSGSVVAVERTFADPAPDSGEAPRSFAQLAETVLVRGISLASLGNSQLLVKSGKRTPSGRLVLPRTSSAMSANPQAFAWAQLKPPVAAETFAELIARLDVLPPSYLRPRRLTENLHVCAIQGVESVAFDSTRQRLTAVLRDREGGRALLAHPFHTRGRLGFEALLAALQTAPEEARFVCGHVASISGELVIHPVSLVLDDGQRRVGLQTWISGPREAASATGNDASAEAAPPLEAYLGQLRFDLSELLLSGLRRSDSRTAQIWRDQATAGARLGFVKLVEPINHLAELLARRAEAVRWDAAPAVRATLELCVLSRAASELVR